MKKSKSTPPKLIPEWDLARGYRDGMRAHSRRRQTHSILLGKALSWHKAQLGTARGGNKGGPMGQFERSAKTWDSLCREQLGMSRPTADRMIRKYENACDLARAEDFTESFPAATDLLFRPLGQLTEIEIGALAEVVEHLVDRMTAIALHIELGIEIEQTAEDDDAGGEESGSQELKIDLPEEAKAFFAIVARKIGKFKESICGTREYRRYKAFIENLPLDDGRDGKPSLRGIKEGLEEAIKAGIGGILEDLDGAIKGQLHGKSSKNGGKKALTQNRR